MGLFTDLVVYRLLDFGKDYLAHLLECLVCSFLYKVKYLFIYTTILAGMLLLILFNLLKLLLEIIKELFLAILVFYYLIMVGLNLFDL